MLTSIGSIFNKRKFWRYLWWRLIKVLLQKFNVQQLFIIIKPQSKLEYVNPIESNFRLLFINVIGVFIFIARLVVSRESDLRSALF